MTGYIFKRNKDYWWAFALIIFLWSMIIISIQYSYKFMGFIIDYGLNYQGVPYSGAFVFLFDGNFGEYGSKELIITLCICLFISILIAYIFTILCNLIKTRVSQRAANRYRWQIYENVRGKKMDMSSGNYLIFLNEDIYKPGDLYLNNYTGIVVYIIGMVYSIVMLGNISPYLIITPIVSMPPLIWFFLKYHKATYGVNKEYREVDGELRNSIAQALCSESDDKLEQFNKTNEKHNKIRKWYSLFSNKYGTILSSFRLSIYLISCVVAGLLVINGKILIGEYLIFISFVNTIFTKFVDLLNTIVGINSSAPRVNKVRTFIKEVCENDI